MPLSVSRHYTILLAAVLAVTAPCPTAVQTGHRQTAMGTNLSPLGAAALAAGWTGRRSWRRASFLLQALALFACCFCTWWRHVWIFRRQLSLPVVSVPVASRLDFQASTLFACCFCTCGVTFGFSGVNSLCLLFLYLVASRLDFQASTLFACCFCTCGVTFGFSGVNSLCLLSLYLLVSRLDWFSGIHSL